MSNILYRDHGDWFIRNEDPKCIVSHLRGFSMNQYDFVDLLKKACRKPSKIKIRNMLKIFLYMSQLHVLVQNAYSK